MEKQGLEKQGVWCSFKVHRKGKVLLVLPQPLAYYKKIYFQTHTGCYCVSCLGSRGFQNIFIPLSLAHFIPLPHKMLAEQTQAHRDFCMSVLNHPRIGRIIAKNGGGGGGGVYILGGFGRRGEEKERRWEKMMQLARHLLYFFC